MSIEWQYALGPFVGAAIGWATNWIAVRMLFRPRREVRVLGFPLQGLIPKRRAEITRRVAEIIEEELITGEDLRGVIESANLSEPILEHAGEKVGRFLREQIASLPGLIRGLVSKEMIDRAQKAVVREVARTLPKLTDDVVEAICAKVDFKRIVIEKLDSIEIERIESLVMRLTRRELRYIILAGAVLGFLVGTVHSLIIWLVR